jgi:hypothetical protein
MVTECKRTTDYRTFHNFSILADIDGWTCEFKVMNSIWPLIPIKIFSGAIVFTESD